MMYKVLRRVGDGRAAPQECETLATAMEAAGHPDPADWQTEPGQPGLLFLATPYAAVVSAATAPCMIEASGVAREFADTYPAGRRADRRWSLCDAQIITAVLEETRNGRSGWRLPYLTACQAGAWLASRYGTGGGAGGSVTTADVHAIVACTYRAACAPRAVPEGVVDEIAGNLVRRLVIAQVTVIGAQALQAPAGTRAWPADRNASPAAPRPWATSRQVPDAIAPAAPLTASALVTVIFGIYVAYGRWARGIMRPVWTIPVPAGRIPSWARRALSWLISHVIIPLGTLITGIALTCWPHPRLAWFGWILSSLLIEKIVNVELRPAAGPAAEHGQERRRQ
jgi:hypothetical protein